MQTTTESRSTHQSNPVGMILRVTLIGLWLVCVGGTGSGELNAQENCLDCHDVDVESVAASVHGFLECLDCHPAAEEVEHSEEIYATNCVDCHDDAVREFNQSIHGIRQASDDPMAMGCRGCHGPAHEMQPADDPSSWIHPLRQPEVCGSCHADENLANRPHIHLVKPLQSYTASIHSRALHEGEDAATWSDCHGSHLVLRAADPSSSVHHLHISGTCSHCHAEIAERYDRSVHGVAAADGVREAPVCTDCHGEHRILEPQRKDSPVHPSNIPKLTCERCHADVQLNEKYGLRTDMVETFRGSYHGLEARFGVTRVANCASCHGVHDILPSSNPESHTHTANLDETCGQCHPGAGTRFAIGPVHVIAEQADHPVVRWIRIAYLWIIYLTIGGMVLHNLLDFIQKFRHPMPRPSVHDVETSERMSVGFRVTHLMLLVSFFFLVYSGFALKYPDAWWSCPMPWWEGSCAWRSTTHRVAAVVMMAAGLLHILHLIVDRRARAVVRQMIPNRRDFSDFKARIEFFVGRRKHPPKAAWMSYPEKMEYLAVVWGTFVMVATGLALWFENLTLRWWPTWVVDAVTAVHFYEAILATLAIVVWHLYAVIFDPMVYPMDTAWLTGKSVPSREEEREEPPAEVVGGETEGEFA